MADSNRAATARVDSGRAAPSSERQAAALERIAAAAESIDGRLGELAAAFDHYRPAIDRAAKLAGSPVAKAASVLGGFPAPRRPGGRRG